MGIHFSPGILPFKLETLTLPTNVYIVIFEVKKSVGDVFAVTPFRIIRNHRIRFRNPKVCDFFIYLLSEYLVIVIISFHNLKNTKIFESKN